MPGRSNKRPGMVGFKDWEVLGLRRGLGTIAPFRHELIELGLVLGHAQALQEIAEFALLVLQTPQRLGTVLVESAVAARGPGPAAMTEVLHLGAHALHFFLPMVVAVTAPTTHASAPQREGEDREAYGPPEYEPKHREHDPRRMPEPEAGPETRMPPFVASCRTAHRSLAL